MLAALLNNKPLFYGGLVSAFFYLVLAWLINQYRYLAPEYVLTSVALFMIYLTYFLTYQAVKNIHFDSNDIKVVFVFSAFFILLMILTVPSDYNDFYHYFFEDLAVVKYGQNPYLVAPLDIPTEPLTWLSGWRFLPAQHGPVRSLMTLPAAWLSQGNLVWGLVWYKLTFAAILGLANFLIYKIAQLLASKQTPLILLLVSWNPLIIFGTFAGGGTDILMMFWLLAAIYLALKDKIYLAVVALTLSVLVKYITILLVPFFLLYFWRRSSTLAGRLQRLGGQLLAAGAVTAVTFWPFWQGVEIFQGVTWVAKFFDVNSFPGFVSLMYALINPQLNWYSLKIVFEAVFVGLYLFLLLKFFRSTDSKMSNLIYFSALVTGWFLLLAKFWFYPKYLIWLLPLLFLSQVSLWPPALFFTGLVVIEPHSSILMPVALVAPTLIFSFYYFLRPQKQFKL